MRGKNQRQKTIDALTERKNDKMQKLIIFILFIFNFEVAYAASSDSLYFIGFNIKGDKLQIVAIEFSVQKSILFGSGMHGGYFDYGISAAPGVFGLKINLKAELGAIADYSDMCSIGLNLGYLQRYLTQDNNLSDNLFGAGINFSLFFVVFDIVNYYDIYRKSNYMDMGVGIRFPIIKQNL